MLQPVYYLFSQSDDKNRSGIIVTGIEVGKYIVPGGYGLT